MLLSPSVATNAIFWFMDNIFWGSTPEETVMGHLIYILVLFVVVAVQLPFYIKFVKPQTKSFAVFTYLCCLVFSLYNNIIENSIVATLKSFQTGGIVHGKGTAYSDSIPIMVSDGEMMLNPLQQTHLFDILNHPGYLGGGSPTLRTRITGNNIDFILDTNERFKSKLLYYNERI